MKKSRVNNQTYQDLRYGSDEEGDLTSARANDASDPSIKETNSEAMSDHIVDQETQPVRGTQKKPYSKPTLIIYGTDRDLARRHEPKI